jgi:hypothetical protein
MAQIFRCYATYLKIRHNGCLVFDPTYPDEWFLSKSEFCDGQVWSKRYGKVKEPKPKNAPKPRGNEVVLRLFVDSDHAGEELTRHSRTGFLNYLNSAPVVWYSTRQGTVETSVVGAEFVAIKNGNKASRGLRYKLHMMGVPLREPTYILGDNVPVVIYNTQRPESVLKKKSIAICYHFMRESVAMGECLTAHIRTEDNPADLCTKVIPGGQLRDRLVSMVLYYSSNLSIERVTIAVTRSIMNAFSSKKKEKKSRPAPKDRV